MAETMLRSVWAVTPWATVLAGLLLALRRPLDGRVSARTFRLAWCLLALRAALPVDLSLPKAPLTAPVPALVQLPVSLPQTPPAAPAMESAAVAPSRLQILAWVWLAGAAAFLLAKLVGYAVYQIRLCRTRRAVQDVAVLAQVQTAFGHAVPVYTAPALAGPMLAGMLRPALYLPADIPAGALPYVLAHEARHRRAGDVPLLFLLLAANACQWFNPVFYSMVRRARRDIELACDEAVLAGQPIAYRQAYGEAVLDTVRRGRRTSALSTGFSGGGRQMKWRFLAMFDTRKKKGGVALMSVLAAVVLAASALVACAGRGESTSQPTPDPTAGSSPALSASSEPQPQSESTAPDSGGTQKSGSVAPVSGAPDAGTPAAEILFPLPGYEDKITTGFGANGHRGTDIQAPEGTPILALCAGVVTEAGNHESYGNCVKVDCGNKTAYLYAHCQSLAVEAGAQVEAGQVLAYVGNSGNSTGLHVHVEWETDGVLQDPASLWGA